MSTARVTCSTQIGQWDKPQIISFDSLFNKYSIECNFEKEDVVKIHKVVSKWIPFVRKIIGQQEGYCRECLYNYLPKDNPFLNVEIKIRTAHIEHSDTPNILYKTQGQASGGLNPLSNTLRAPMSKIMSDIIEAYGLSDVAVPKKGLVPLCSKEVISGLNENTMNDAFVVCVEKIDTLTRAATVDLVRQMSRLSQEKLGNQFCTLIEKTGACNLTWNDFAISTSTDDAKFYCLDTQPLDGELLIDMMGQGFETSCKESKILLQERAKNGLETFQYSSNLYGLSPFEDIAQSFLEKMD